MSSAGGLPLRAACRIPSLVLISKQNSLVSILPVLAVVVVALVGIGGGIVLVWREIPAGLIVVLFAVVAAAAGLSMHAWSTRRLRKALADDLLQLRRQLADVQRKGDFAVRLSEDAGTEEFQALLKEINVLLHSIEETQQAFVRANAEMQQHVSERTAALAEANKALEADIARRVKLEQESEALREQLVRASKMEAVGTLAGGIAHDFNNILAGMLGHIQIVAGDLPADHPVQTYLQQILSAGDRATALVRQILAFSRQTHGERKLVSVGQVAREALSLLRAALPSGIAIRCQVEAVSDFVNADPTQLHQVFMNLGANSGHAIGTHGGELVIRISNFGREQLSAAVTHPMPFADYICIEVRDTGCGMSREVMARIFDPFFSTKPVNEGTGLGLAVVHGIVTDHGGSIRVESEPGRGTTFTIYLPAAENSPTSPASQHSIPLKGNERILVVDDEELVLGAIGGTLMRLGYRVTTELQSREALRRFQESPDDFDLVVTDQTMPNISGLELAEAVHAVRPSLPVILVTGYSPDVSGRSVQSLGVIAVLGKPIDFAELTGIMRSAFTSGER